MNNNQCINAKNPCQDCSIDRIMAMSIDQLRDHCLNLEMLLDMELNHVQPKMQQEIYDLVGYLEDVIFCIEKGFQLNAKGIKKILKKYEK